MSSFTLNTNKHTHDISCMIRMCHVYFPNA